MSSRINYHGELPSSVIGRRRLRRRSLLGRLGLLVLGSALFGARAEAAGPGQGSSEQVAGTSGCTELDGIVAVVDRWRGDGRLILGRERSALGSIWPEGSVALALAAQLRAGEAAVDETSLAWLLLVKGRLDLLGNPYVAATRAVDEDGTSLEQRVHERVMGLGSGIAPGDFLEAALAAADGDYPLATLAGHNYLKELTYAGRLGEWATLAWGAGGSSEGGVRLTGDEVGAVAARFVSLRAEDDPERADRLGPWYHAFGILFVGAVAGVDEAAVVAAAESALRRAGIGSPEDAGKERVNGCAAVVARRVAVVIGRGR